MTSSGVASRVESWNISPGSIYFFRYHPTHLRHRLARTCNMMPITIERVPPSGLASELFGKCMSARALRSTTKSGPTARLSQTSAATINHETGRATLERINLIRILMQRLGERGKDLKRSRIYATPTTPTGATPPELTTPRARRKNEAPDFLCQPYRGPTVELLS